MKIHIKSEKEIEVMSKGGEILAKIIGQLIKYAKPGFSTAVIENKANLLCCEYNVKPAFLNYCVGDKLYPASVCVCLNEEVVHGVPKKDKIIEKGDVVTIDMGIIYKGYYTDMARTIGVGTIDKKAENVILASRAGLNAAIKRCVPGNRLSDVCKSIYRAVTKYGCRPMLELVGHGIGKKLHEDPAIPGYWIDGLFEDFVLQRRMTFAVESIVTSGKKCRVKVSKEDGWTAWPRDKALTAAFEDTVVVDNPPRILTSVENIE